MLKTPTIESATCRHQTCCATAVATTSVLHDRRSSWWLPPRMSICC